MQQEAERWRTLAQQHGFGSAEGRFVLGRFRPRPLCRHADPGRPRC